MMLLNLAHTLSEYAICGEGNVSQRQSDTSFLVKASGSSLHNLSETDLTLCDLNGNKINFEHKKPSIETLFHAWIMKNFPEINYIAHTHPTHTNKILCTDHIHSFAINRLFPDQVIRNGKKSCVVPYATPGEKLLIEIERSINFFIDNEDYFPKLILLQNHGIIVASSSYKECIASTFMCEKSAQIFIGSIGLGKCNFLDPNLVNEVFDCPNEKYRRELLK